MVEEAGDFLEVVVVLASLEVEVPCQEELVVASTDHEVHVDDGHVDRVGHGDQVGQVVVASWVSLAAS